MKPKLYNRKTGAPADAVYIGRGSAWGNPFPIGPATREEVIARFKAEVVTPEYAARVRACLRGKNLVCWCVPHACHGEVLLEIANAESQ